MKLTSGDGGSHGNRGAHPRRSARAFLSRRSQLIQGWADPDARMSDVLLDRSRRERNLLLDSAVTLGVAGLCAAVAFTVARALNSLPTTALEWVAPAILSSLAPGFLFMAAWHYFGQERIEVDAGSVIVARSLGPFRRHWSAEVDGITGFDVPALGREFVQGAWGVGLPSLHLRTRQGVLRCCVGIPPAEAQHVGAALWEAAQRAGAGRPTKR